MMWLQELSYAWALLPLFIWVLIAYIRRWHSYNEIIEEYSHSINLEAINLTVMAQPGEVTHHRYEFLFKNTISKPIEYNFTSLKMNGANIEGHFDNKRGVIRPNSTAKFFLPALPVSGAAKDVIEFEMVYGSPRKPNLRQWHKSVSAVLVGESISYTDIKDDDKEFLDVKR